MYTSEMREIMFTISNIIEDINRGCTAHNMIEECFSYRIVFFVNEVDGSTKHYIDTSYGDLRKSLESIVRENLSTTKSIVIAQITTRKNGEVISLLSRSYPFSLNAYFQQIAGKKEKEFKIANYGRRVNWC